MPYIVVEDFRLGVDRRSTRIAGTPGSLWAGINVHITRGKVIERRKRFVSTYTLPAGTFGLSSAGGLLYVFGSIADPGVPSGVNYQRLQHPDGSGYTMTALLDTEVFDGSVYAIAEFSDGSVHHYYNGEMVEDWDAGIARPDMSDNAGIAEHLADLVNQDEDVSAAAAGDVVTVTGRTSEAFKISATAENGEGNALNDQTATVATTQTAIAGRIEVLALGSFKITGGTSTPGTNKIDAVKVDGIEILGAAVDWDTSNSATAAAVAAQITSNVSTPEYSATAAGDTVTISAAVGTGDGPNGYVVEVTKAGDVTVADITNMAGGVDAGSGRVQISTVTIGGTFEAGDEFTITVNDRTYGRGGRPPAKGRTALTFKKKIYSAAGSLLNFCGVDSPTIWDPDNVNSPGAGFLNFANQDGGSEAITAVGKYQGNLAVFSRSTIQIEYVDVDDAANQLLQPVENTGTRSPKSVRSYGNNDTFYLDDSGVRSLRARDSSNTAAVNDIGTAIDPLLQEYMDDLTEDEIAAAVSVIEPRDGRYWLALGTRIFVFSYFPGSKISAWSYYDITDDVGGAIDDFARREGRIYARSGNTIYLYGGAGSTTYPDDDEVLATVELPYLSAKTAATFKNLEGFDMALTGEWRVHLLPDPYDDTVEIDVGTINKTSYGQGRIGVPGETTHAALKLVCSRAGPATISNLAVHYEDPHEAG